VLELQDVCFRLDAFIGFLQWHKKTLKRVSVKGGSLKGTTAENRCDARSRIEAELPGVEPVFEMPA